MANLWIISCVLLASTLIEAQSDGRARAIGKISVFGEGVTVKAKSASQCLQMCNRVSECDAASFHSIKYKCLLISRCAPIKVGKTNSKSFFFSKRPRVLENGFVYHQDSDSCLKLVEEMTDFASADQICRSQGGRLATLDDPNINRFAAELLRNSDAQFAWIGLADIGKEGDPTHTNNGRKVSETGFFPVAEQGQRNDSTRNCWSLSDSGEWLEHSCKTRKQYSICQIETFSEIEKRRRRRR